MRPPKVSVVISTFNRPEMLSRALASVHNQTFKDFEVVVVDDCSPPAGPDFPQTYKDVFDEWGDKFDKRGVTLWPYRLGENSGYQCMPKNKAIERAAGDYIAYLDDDNTWRPDHLDVAVNGIEWKDLTTPNFSTDMVYTRLCYVIADETVRTPTHPDNTVCLTGIEKARASQDNTCKKEHTFKETSLRELVANEVQPGDAIGIPWDPTRLQIANYIDTSTILHSKGAFWRMVRETGYGWDESLRRFGDWNFVWRWAVAGNNAKLIDKVTVDYNIHAQSMQVSRPALEVPVCLSYEQYRLFAKGVRAA